MDIFARGLVNTTVPANGSCPYEPAFLETAGPIFGNVSFYHFNVYLSGACTAFSTLTIWLLQYMHATHFSRPAEQTKIIRIAHLIPTYSLISFFCVLVPSSYYYLNPWLDVVQSIALATFFLLLCEFIAPNENQRIVFFAAIDLPSQRDRKSGTTQRYDTLDKKLVWYRRKWISIFQYPPVALLVAVATCITQAVGIYCEISYSPRFSHLYLFLVSNFSVSAAVTAIINSYIALKKHLAHHQPLAKLAAFKLVVGLSFLQGILFAILQGTGAMHPTETLTYADVKIGIPTMITCIEMVPISIFFHYAYSYKAYCLDSKLQPVPSSESKVPAQAPVRAYQGGFLGYRAFLLALNPMEVIEGFIFTFKIASEFEKYQQQARNIGHTAAMEPLRAQNGSPSAMIRDDHPSYTAPYTDTAQNAYTGYGQVPLNEYPSQQRPREGSYGQSPQRTGYGSPQRPYDYNIAPEYSYGASQQLGVPNNGRGPSPPRASHSRSPSRTLDVERTPRSFIDGGA